MLFLRPLLSRSLHPVGLFFFLVRAIFYWFSSNGSLAFHLLHHAARHFTGISHSIHVQFHSHGEIYPLSPHLKRLLQHRCRPVGPLLEKQEAKYTRPKTEPYWCIPALSYVLYFFLQVLLTQTKIGCICCWRELCCRSAVPHVLCCYRICWDS